jgi:hypothetical protein
VNRGRAVLVVALAACGHPAPRTEPPPPTGNVGVATADAAAAIDGIYDDCTLQREAIASKLLHGTVGTKTLLEPTFDPEERHLHERIELSDGVVVAFAIGGCAHYAYELEYELPATAVPNDAERRLDALEALLRRTPIADDLAIDFADRIRKRAKPATPRDPAGPWELDCGDAICTVDVTPDGQVVRMKVSYDFPL